MHPIQTLILSIFLFAAALSPVSAQSNSDRINPENVTIARDQWGVPHIHGRTDAETIYGLAYATAEDNFYNMQLNMLMSRGRQGEVLGKDGAIVDYAVQLFRARELVESRFETDISAEYKVILAAYVQGANDYAMAHPDELLLKGVFPVNEVDVLVGYVMSMALIGGVGQNLLNILNDQAGGPTPYSLKGSNGFAFNSRKTADGSVYIANNSHQPLNGPSSWYEAHIMSDEGLNCHGALFPGGASIFAGVNPDLAWMHTVNFPDIVDVYELEMNPDEKLQYKMDGEWKTLEMRKIKLKVKLGPAKITVKRKLYWSVYGPTIERKDKFSSIRFSALHTIKSAEQWFQMNKASNFTEFYETLKMGGLSNLNVVYADRRDTIFYISNGLYPVRKEGFDWGGLLKGNTSDNLWTEFHPVEDLPQVLCPPSGYVFNTNNTPFDCTGPADNPKRSAFPVSQHNYQYDNNRSLRFQELTGALDKITWEDFLRIKYDDQYPDEIYIYFMENANGIFRLDKAKYPDLAEQIDLLNSWDRRGTIDSEAAGFFVPMYYEMVKQVAKEEEVFVRKSYSDDFFAEAMRKTKKRLQRKFGTWKPPLGEVQRLVRGEMDLPLGGMPDVLRAMNSKPWKSGRRKGWLGDSYIQLIRFSESGVEFSSTNIFGASEKEDSPHYADQMEPFYLAGKTKPYRLEQEWLEKNTVQKYHPGER